MIRVKNKGFTLIESLIAMVISVIAVAAMFFAYQYFNSAYKSIGNRATISEAGRNSLSQIAKDLRNAGYKNKNYQGTWDKKIELKNNSYEGGDHLTVWFNTNKSTKAKSEYYIKKIDGENHLVTQLFENGSAVQSTPVSIVENATDFQVILRDKNGAEITAVNEANQDTVHTAEVYVTVRSYDELYRTNRITKIFNNLNSTTGRDEELDEDKYHRETFFLSVHLRNLAKS